MKILRRIFFLFVGRQAYTKNSKGKLWKNNYFIKNGYVNKGEMIFTKGDIR